MTSLLQQQSVIHIVDLVSSPEPESDPATDIAEAYGEFREEDDRNGDLISTGEAERENEVGEMMEMDSDSAIDLTNEHVLVYKSAREDHDVLEVVSISSSPEPEMQNRKIALVERSAGIQALPTIMSTHPRLLHANEVDEANEAAIVPLKTISGMTVLEEQEHRQAKPTLLTLPPEILLQIASHFLSDYHFWTQPRFKHLRRRLTMVSSINSRASNASGPGTGTTSLSAGVGSFCPYVCLALTHPYLYALLLGLSGAGTGSLRVWRERRRKEVQDRKVAEEMKKERARKERMSPHRLWRHRERKRRREQRQMAREQIGREAEDDGSLGVGVEDCLILGL